MSLPKCANCGMPMRKGCGVAAFVFERGGLRSAVVCMRCVRSSVSMVVPPAQPDPAPCRACRSGYADYCVICMGPARARAIRDYVRSNPKRRRRMRW
jgi:hypothetical protein